MITLNTKFSKFVAITLVTTLVSLFMINLLIHVVWVGIIILALSTGYWVLINSNLETPAVIEAITAFFKRKSRNGG